VRNEIKRKCKCGETDLKQFYTHATQHYCYECKKCCKKRAAISWKKNGHKWTKKNKEWLANNKDKRRIYTRKQDLKRKYNLTIEQFEQMKEKQNNLCKICNSSNKLVVDHCHKTNKVRGLLCNECNKGLGFFRDNRKFLDIAIQYLEGL